MRLELYRYSSGKESTLGILYLIDDENKKQFLCYTLEDEKRDVKIYGETRIPSGQYFLGLRKQGGYNQKYSVRFPKIHKGMLHLLDVPNFSFILIHCGNTDDDSAGCILVGDTSQQNISKEGFIGNSTTCYRRIYPIICQALEKQKKMIIKIVNFEDKS